MKGTVILRYVGNRPEPEESAVARMWDEILFAPPLPTEWLEFQERCVEAIQREMEGSFKIPVGGPQRRIEGWWLTSKSLWSVRG
jgi:hypothetical protein